MRSALGSVSSWVKTPLVFTSSGAGPAAARFKSTAVLAGTGGILRDEWPDLDLERQQAIIKAVLDHAVIAPGTPGARRLDINRVQPHWRI